MVKQEHKTQIINGLKAGMTLEDMYILMGCDAADIIELDADELFQAEVKAAPKMLEFDLLRNMHAAIKIQEAEGKTAGAQWFLEKINPRWAGKTDNTKPGVINISFGNKKMKLEDEDSVEVFIPTKSSLSDELLMGDENSEEDENSKEDEE